MIALNDLVSALLEALGSKPPDATFFHLCSRTLDMHWPTSLYAIDAETTNYLKSLTIQRWQLLLLLPKKVTHENVSASVMQGHVA